MEIDGNLGCFQFCLVFCFHSSWVFQFICEEILRVYNGRGLAGLSGIYGCSNLPDSSKLFSKVIVSIYNPPGCVREAPLVLSLPHTYALRLLNFWQEDVPCTSQVCPLVSLEWKGAKDLWRMEWNDFSENPTMQQELGLPGCEHPETGSYPFCTIPS